MGCPGNRQPRTSKLKGGKRHLSISPCFFLSPWKREEEGQEEEGQEEMEQEVEQEKEKEALIKRKNRHSGVMTTKRWTEGRWLVAHHIPESSKNRWRIPRKGVGESLPLPPSLLPSLLPHTHTQTSMPTTGPLAQESQSPIIKKKSGKWFWNKVTERCWSERISTKISGES